MHVKTMAVTGPGAEFERFDVELSDLRDKEVLVEIHGVGLCHTDLAARDGIYGLPYPLVLGHEGSGTVKEVGAKVESVAPGDNVTISLVQ